jgi:hypothetical protein
MMMGVTVRQAACMYAEVVMVGVLLWERAFIG